MKIPITQSFFLEIIFVFLKNTIQHLCAYRKMDVHF